VDQHFRQSAVIGELWVEDTWLDIQSEFIAIHDWVGTQTTLLNDFFAGVGLDKQFLGVFTLFKNWD